jgi:hypothetical protein
MGYRLTTFQVQFVAEPKKFPTGLPCRLSADVEKLGHPSPCGLESMNRGCPKRRSLPLREYRPPSLKLAHQHYQPDYDGNQQEQIDDSLLSISPMFICLYRAGFHHIPFFSAPI